MPTCPTCAPAGSSAACDAHPTPATASHDEQALDCTHRVTDVIAQYPATAAVFNRFGIDTCCGGYLSVAAAAQVQGVDSKALCHALREAIDGPAAS